MARYIDADELKNEFCEACSTHKKYCMTVEQCRAKEKEQPDRKWCFKMRLIDNAPTADVVEVVRCVQCKHWKINPNNLYGGYCRYCEGASIDHYCSYGERKTDDGNL